MDKNEKPFGEWTNEEKHFQPEWLDTVRAEMNEAMQEMTPEVRIAYINERAAQFRAKMAERQEG